MFNSHVSRDLCKAVEATSRHTVGANIDDGARLGQLRHGCNISDPNIRQCCLFALVITSCSYCPGSMYYYWTSTPWIVQVIKRRKQHANGMLTTSKTPRQSMELVPESISGYVWAAIGGGGVVLFILAFCCIYRSIKQALSNAVWARESTNGLEEAGAYRKVVVGPQQARKSSAGGLKERGWLGVGKSLKQAKIVPLGLRGRGVSVPGEELRKHMRQEEMVFADAPVPGLVSK